MKKNNFYKKNTFEREGGKENSTTSKRSYLMCLQLLYILTRTCFLYINVPKCTIKIQMIVCRLYF